MEQSVCPNCKKDLDSDFRFCPNCGNDLKKPIECPNCKYINEYNSKFCQECGFSLLSEKIIDKKVITNSQKTEGIDEIDPPPQNGITIEFPYSTAQSFEFAVSEAEKISTFKKYLEDKKAIYRVTVEPDEMEILTELLENLKGWRKRTVYLNGEKVTWDSIFSYSWCYDKKRSSFKPEVYCYGYENEWQLNLWGCIQANMPFIENSNWFSWGKWQNNKGDWQFDKERILHELQKNLYKYRFCPAFKPEIVQDVINSLPYIANPLKDKNWKFVESWGNETVDGLKLVTERYGYKETVIMKGVAPNGNGAIKEIIRKMKFPIPQIYK